MTAEQRLRRKSEFDAVFRDGLSAASGPLALRARWRGEAWAEQPCRFGYAVSARLGGAVTRNRIRRRLREAARVNSREGSCRGLDVVVIARMGAVEAEYAELDATMRRLVSRVQRRVSRSSEGGVS